MSKGNRPNNAIWKIESRDDLNPEQLLDHVLEQYQKRVEDEPGKYASLNPVKLKNNDRNERLRLFRRKRNVTGMYGFVEDILDDSVDQKSFMYFPVDTCLFIFTDSNLYVITSGSGYHIIEDFVDYTFPFNVAKKLIANSFKAAQKRKFAGSALSVDEKYRVDMSIDKNKSLDSIWKSLIGKVDPGQIIGGGYLNEMIDPERPPTAEIKSSFTLKKSLPLDDVIRLVDAIENLPNVTDERKKDMEFLDCLQPIKSSSLKNKLNDNLKYVILQALQGEKRLDLDVCDPVNIEQYTGGSAFRIGKGHASDDRPDIDDVINEIGEQLKDYIDNDELFYDKVGKMKFTYTIGEDAQEVKRAILHMLHGQVNMNDKPYFLIDKKWYYGQGDYLENLVEDFIECVFRESDPIILDGKNDIGLVDWDSKWDEDKFNKEQAKSDGYYLGDKIFFYRGNGKLELFDLLRVDEANKKVYIIHVKDDFDAKVRDVCSQITTARDIFNKSKQDNSILNKYYEQWAKTNANVTLDTFLSWFSDDYTQEYVIVCSTPHDFTEKVFEENNAMQSYVAKREIVIVKQSFKENNNTLHLAHVRKVKND